MISTLITVIVYLLVLGLLWWLIDYVLGVVPLPDPIKMIIRVIMIVIIVIVVIYLLLSLLPLAGGGHPLLR